MVVVADGKLAFSKDRVVSATQASKNFGECRRRAKREPLFVTDRNASIETVIVDYDEFEAMAVELEQLRLQRLYDVAAQRLAAIDRDPSGETVPFSVILGDEGYDAFLALDPDDLPDGGLFA